MKSPTKKKCVRCGKVKPFHGHPTKPSEFPRLWFSSDQVGWCNECSYGGTERWCPGCKQYKPIEDFRCRRGAAYLVPRVRIQTASRNRFHGPIPRIFSKKSWSP